jgi:hypothetical protein
MQLLLENKVRLHGRSLTNLANLALTIIVITGGLSIAGMWLIDIPPQSPSWQGLRFIWQQSPAPPTNQRLALTLAELIWTSALLAPALALRVLGKNLQNHELLSRQTAKAFGGLAHAIPAYAALNASANLLRSYVSDGELSVDGNQLYLLLVTGICLYTVAHLMRLAATAAEDARSIV